MLFKKELAGLRAQVPMIHIYNQNTSCKNIILICLRPCILRLITNVFYARRVIQRWFRKTMKRIQKRHIFGNTRLTTVLFPTSSYTSPFCHSIIQAWLNKSEIFSSPKQLSFAIVSFPFSNNEMYFDLTIQSGNPY